MSGIPNQTDWIGFSLSQKNGFWSDEEANPREIPELVVVGGIGGMGTAVLVATRIRQKYIIALSTIGENEIRNTLRAQDKPNKQKNEQTINWVRKSMRRAKGGVNYAQHQPA